MRVKRVGLISLVGISAWLAGAAAWGATDQHGPSDATYPKIDGALISAKSTVVETQTASGGTTSATITFEGSSGSGPLANWIGVAVAGLNPTKAIEFLSFNGMYRETEDDKLPAVSIQTIEFPALDGSSKNATEWKVKLNTVGSSPLAGDQSSMPNASSFTNPHPLWQSNFKLSIDGLDGSHVTKISSFTATPSTALKALPPKPGPRGVQVAGGMVPAGASVTDFVLAMSTTGGSATAYQGFQQWLSSGAAPKNGSIAYLSGDLSTTVCTSTFSGLVITKITAAAGGVAQIDIKVGGLRFACQGI